MWGELTLYVGLLGLVMGLLIGFFIAWYVVDRDYAEHQRRQVRGEAHLPAALSFRVAPKGEFYDIRIHE